MKKRSQIRKYTVEQVKEFIKDQTHPEVLKMYAEHVRSKNQKLIEQKKSLIDKLDSIRQKTQKIAYQMNDNVEDRLQKKETVVMTAKSRPTTQDIREMTALFAYMENQTNLINRNNKDLEELKIKVSEISSNITFPDCDYTELDNIYRNLEQKCQQEEKVRDDLLAQRDKRRQFYATLDDTLKQYRIKYDKIEEQIASRQKELDHLKSYFKTRQNQDREKIRSESRMSQVLEEELLKAQQIVNYNQQKTMDLKIRKIEFDGELL